MPSINNPVTNHKHIEVILKQATLRWPTQRREEDCQENDKPEKAEREGQGAGTWVAGGTEEDNERYLEFLRYCEEQREESLRRREEDEDRKKRALAKEKAWEMMRESVNFLKSNEERWRTRRIEECDRIREEEKRDRLAIAREKKKRYGLKKLSVEENRRLKRRTEDRL